MTSANFSKPAWGTMVKTGPSKTETLMIKSYELGVLYIPNDHALVSIQNCSRKREPDDANTTVTMPVPYVIPPRPYGPGDGPWTWGVSHPEPDVYGNTDIQ